MKGANFNTNRGKPRLDLNGLEELQGLVELRVIRPAGLGVGAEARPVAATEKVGAPEGGGARPREAHHKPAVPRRSVEHVRRQHLRLHDFSYFKVGLVAETVNDDKTKAKGQRAPIYLQSTRAPPVPSHTPCQATRTPHNIAFAALLVSHASPGAWRSSR